MLCCLIAIKTAAPSMPTFLLVGGGMFLWRIGNVIRGNGVGYTV